MSLSALSTNRNYVNCCDDIRPFISTVETTTAATTGAIANVAATEIDLEDIDELTLQTLIANEITASTITTFTLTTTNISSFTVQTGNDVNFIGSNNDNQFIWDSSRDTLYVDGFLKTRDCLVYLNNAQDESPLDISDANRDAGVAFKWYDDNTSEEKLGYFGFKDNTERFTFIPNVNVNIADCTVSAITQDNGDFEMRDIYARNIINEDIGRNLGISSVDNINIVADNINLTTSVDTTILSTAGDVNVVTTAGNLNLDITGNTTIDIKEGVFDILVDGDENDGIIIESTQGTVDILTASTSAQAIYLHTDSGGILIDNDSPDKDTIIQTGNNIQLSTTGTTVALFNETDGLTVNKPKTDYLQWIPYYKFDAFSGFWFSNRSTPSNPLHFWRKEAVAETARIYADFEVSSRTTTDKGYQLTSIFFAYNITGASITSITPTITLKSFNPAVPGEGPTLLNLASTDVNLTAGTAINEHYRSIDITTPFFLNSEGVINVELEIVTGASSVFEFYGCHLKFDRNHL